MNLGVPGCDNRDDAVFTTRNGCRVSLAHKLQFCPASIKPEVTYAFRTHFGFKLRLCSANSALSLNVISCHSLRQTHNVPLRSNQLRSQQRPNSTPVLRPSIVTKCNSTDTKQIQIKRHGLCMWNTGRNSSVVVSSIVISLHALISCAVGFDAQHPTSS